MKTIESVLITGANAGLGRECARQMAGQDTVQKIYLACRNELKAQVAKTALEKETGREIFEIVLMDVMDLESVRAAVSGLKRPIDAVVLNAGGMGGATPNALTDDGVTHMFAVNVLGHSVLVDELIERDLLTSVVLYAGSEAARGIPKMGVTRPVLDTSSVDEFAAVADGSRFGPTKDPMLQYGAVKLTAALWMASMARQHTHLRFVTMSPGGTTGTNGMDDLPLVQRIFFKYIGRALMPLFGMMHGLDVGAKRYVDGLVDAQTFETGGFYASKAGSPTGAVVDQAALFSELGNRTFQDNANLAIHRFAAAS